MSEENFIIYTLIHPIETTDKDGNKAQITELKLVKRLKGKILKKLPRSFFENEGEGIIPADLLPFIAAIANISEEIVDELDLEDIEKIAKKVEHFFDKSPKTGKN